MADRDAINPSHYAKPGTPFECIDVLRAALTPEEYVGFLRGNVIKYQYRARAKYGTFAGFVQDVRKATWYQDRLDAFLRETGGEGYDDSAKQVDEDRDRDPRMNALAVHGPDAPENTPVTDPAVVDSDKWSRSHYAKQNGGGHK